MFADVGRCSPSIGKPSQSTAMPVVQQKMRPTNSVIYGTLRYTLQAIRCCASYILLNRLGLGINFIQWIPLRSYKATEFVTVALFVLTPAVWGSSS